MPQKAKLGSNLASLQPKEIDGHLQRTSTLCDVLDECLRLSAMLRGDLFGEGESSSGQDAPRNGNVDSLMSAALEMANILRTELESVVTRVNPTSVKAVTRG